MRKHNLRTFCLILIFLAGFNSINADDFVPVKGMTIGENYIVFEAEATNSPLGKWEVITPEDSRYKNSMNYPPINNTHLEFTGNNPSVGSANSPLDYTFKCPKSGAYRLGGRLFQRLEGQPDDKCNDVYIRMAGDFTSANTVTTAQLKTNQKFFGRGVDSWGALAQIEVGHHQGPAVYNLKKDEIYTLTISGRAQRTNVDYWLLYETSLPITVALHQDLMGVNAEKYRPIIEACETFYAVDMLFKNIAGFNDAETDEKLGMELLQVTERDAWAAAQMVFQGSNGLATFTLNTNQEVDGESTYRLKINGSLIGEVQNDRIHGTSIPDYTVQLHTINSNGVQLNNGDTIQIEFNNTSNGLVPEGSLTATSRGRWLSLDICTTGSFASYYVSLTNNAKSIQIGDSLLLNVDAVLPYNLDTTLFWNSSNPEVVSVDSTGKIWALKNGEASVFVKSINEEYIDSCKVMVYTSLPFSGTPITIPGVIEAEDYDLGGEGMAYHDVLPYNAGNEYRRSENVDIELCNDGGYNIRSTENGEWLAYTIEVAETGIYAFHANVASLSDARELKIEMDNSVLIESIVFSNTGGEDQFKSVITESIQLTKGKHVLKIYFVTGDIKLSWIGFFTPETVFKVEQVSVSPSKFRLDADESRQMEATVLPVIAPDKTITWTTSDANIARVSATGLVTGRNQGKAYIKATSADGLVADSAQVSVYGTTSLQEPIQTVRVYPNPSSGIFYLPNSVNWKVYNAMGSEVCKGQGTLVNLIGNKKGLYLLKTEHEVYSLWLK